MRGSVQVWRRWLRGGAVLIATFALGAGGRASAAGMVASETIFPAATRAWISIPDFRGMQERFRKSPYGQLVNDPAMEKFVTHLREQIAKNGKQRLAKLGLTLDDLEKIPGGELAAAAIETEGGRLSTVLAVDTTGHEDEARALVERIGTRLVEQKAVKIAIKDAPPQLTVYELPPDPLAPAAGPAARRVAFALAPQALVVGDDALHVGQVFAVLGQGRADSLATVDSYQAIVEQVRGQLAADAAPIRWFVDPLKFAVAFQKTNPPREKRKGPDYVAILARQGFDCIRAAGGVAAFAPGQHALRHHTMIHAPALPGRDPESPERFDLAARMLRFPNAADTKPQAWVPADVAGWVAGQWDVQTAFASAESLVDDIVGEKGVFKDVIASIKEEPDGPQIDIEKDLVAHLGRRISVITDHVEPISTDSERLVIALEVTDEEQVAAAVAKIMNADSDMRRIQIGDHVAWELIDQSEAIPKLEVETPGVAPPTTEHDPNDEAHRRRQRMRQKEEKLLPHSCVTVARGHVLIGSHRDFLEKVLASDGERLAAAVDYAAVQAELAAYVPGSAALRGFGREDESIRPTYELLRSGEMPKSKSLFGQLLNDMLGDGKPGSVREQRIDGSTLPEFETVRHHFGVSGMVMESRTQGWYVVGLVLPRTRELARTPEAAKSR